MTLNEAKKKGLFQPNAFITRRVMRRYTKNFIAAWKKKNKVTGHDLKGHSLNQQLEMIGGIK